jgi:hypothetical protein
VTHELLDAFNPDAIEDEAEKSGTDHGQAKRN